ARLLLPALGQLLTEQPERRVELVGAGVENWDDARWRETVSHSFATTGSHGPAVEALVKATHYRPTDVTSTDQLRTLLASCSNAPALYFALPPAVTAKACDALAGVDLPEGTRFAMEKPFGSDVASAKALNARVLSLVPEDRVHRVDHFLANSTVLNLLGLRFANRIFEPLWNAENIERVEIVYDEELALENRARYYDKAGALIDMLQSHLLQVMGVFAMEPPATLGARDIRDNKAAVIRAAHVWHDDVAASSRRARYEAGTIGTRTLPAYIDEAGVDPSRRTETLAEITLGIENWRWAGVPFTLRSGKALGEARHDITVTFRAANHIPEGLLGGEEPTRLCFRMGPDSMSLDVNVNGPGDPYTLDRRSLQADFGAGALKAYGEVLAGIFDDDPTLSVRGDTAEECWRIVEPVLAAWRRGDVPLDGYAAGSAGPEAWAPLP
ncbi:MAG TPA: glucose-6-phosphate dehydrogenase, partial [Microbacteriaceae bacterium]|nr:glucose-6-phosphate dehydrogenase [Microbacteriaceae bacterium]